MRGWYRRWAAGLALGVLVAGVGSGAEASGAGPRPGATGVWSALLGRSIPLPAVLG